MRVSHQVSRQLNTSRLLSPIDQSRKPALPPSDISCTITTCRFEAFAVEPSAQLREFALRTLAIELFPTIDALDNTVGVWPFDVITSHDVIEHIVANQLPYHLTPIREHLRNDGRFLGNTPNLESLNIRRKGAKDRIISPPHHCINFSCDTPNRGPMRHGLGKDALLAFELSAFFLPANGTTLIAKISIVLQKAFFDFLWPLLRILGPNNGYQIFLLSESRHSGAPTHRD